MALASQRKDINWSSKAASGEDSPNFTGGKYIDDKGYVRVLRPEHPKNIRGYAYEHRLVVEKYLGRFLEAWETVHHINEVKQDNRIDNLFLCSLHKEGTVMSVEHREKMRQTAYNNKPHTKKKNYAKNINFR